MGQNYKHSFPKQIMISDEETRLGIPGDRDGFRAVQDTSADVRHANLLYLPSIRDGGGDSPRRPRREIVDSVLFDPLPLRPIQLPVPLNIHPHHPLPASCNNMNVFP